MKPPRPVRLTRTELETVHSRVKSKNAHLVLKYLHRNPVASSTGLTKLVGGNFSSAIHNSINKRLKKCGLRIRFHKGNYMWERFRLPSSNLPWAICPTPTPTTDKATVWIIR